MTIAERRPEVERLPRPGEVRIRTIAPRRVLEVKGRGRPDSPSFRAAVEALFTVAYGVHFRLKRRGIEARVGALEGLWAFDRNPFEGDARADRGTPKAQDGWAWSLLIELPDFASDDDLDAATATARARHLTPELEALRAIWFEEGEVVEALHVGSYATEPQTIARMAATAAEAGRVAHGPHHEIYLGDPRRSAPERLRTVLRQPIGREERPSSRATAAR